MATAWPIRKATAPTMNWMPSSTSPAQPSAITAAISQPFRSFARSAA